MAVVPASMADASFRRGSLPGVQLLNRRSLSDNQARLYLERIGLELSEVSVPDLNTLRKIQAAHVDTVPYEVLDLHFDPNAPMPCLDPHQSFERVVAKKRGGYCYIVVDAFAALLCTLGFSVSMHISGVGNDPLPKEKWGNHVVLLVAIGGKSYVADVGLGDGPSCPFELAEHSWTESPGFEYSLSYRGCGVWHFTHDSTGSFEGFEFDTSSSLCGADEASLYHSYYWHNAESPYRSKGIVMQRKAVCGCTYTLCSRTLRKVLPESAGGSQVVATLGSRAEWLECVNDYFGLQLVKELSSAQLDELWRAACRGHATWVADKDRARMRAHVSRLAKSMGMQIAAAFTYFNICYHKHSPK